MSESLRKSIKVEIPYVNDKGTFGIKTVTINFISQKIMEMYTAYINEITEVIELSHRAENIVSEIGATVIGGLDSKLNFEDRVSAIKELNEELESIKAKIKGYSDIAFDRKYELIQLILKKNNVTDHNLLSRDWWVDCVDVNGIMKFIKDACEKDNELINKKKKILK